MHSNGSGDSYHVSFDAVHDSALAFGPNSTASYVNQIAGGVPDRDVAAEIISKLDELIRGIEEHWDALADPADIRHELKMVRTGVRDQEHDKTTLSNKLTRVVTRLAPVSVLTELAASIAELVGHLH